MKKKIIVVLLVVMCFMFIGNVKALKMYNDFSPEDKVNVYLNENATGEFTVIDDEPEYIAAIYNTHYGDENSLYEYQEAKKLIDKIKNDWILVDSVHFLSANDIVNKFDNTDVEFRSPSWAMTNFPYWTSTVADLNGKQTPFYIENWPEYSMIKSGVSGSLNTKAYVRPVIRIKKSYVKGGVNRPKTWDEFVEYFGEFLNYEDSKVNYTHDDNSLKLSYIDTENNGVYFAKYEFDGTFLTMVEENTYYTSVMADYVFSSLPFESIIELESYVTDNGFNHDNFKMIVDNSTNEITEFKVNLDYFFGINNKSNNQVSDVINNPKTNDINVLLIGASLLLVGFITIVGIKKLKKLSK